MIGVLWHSNKIYKGYKSFPTKDNPTPEEWGPLYQGYWFEVLERRGASENEEWLKLRRLDENGAAAILWMPRKSFEYQVKVGIQIPSVVQVVNPMDYDPGNICRQVIITDECYLYKSSSLQAEKLRQTTAKPGEWFDENAETNASGTEPKFGRFFYTDGAGVLQKAYFPLTYFPAKGIPYGSPVEMLVLCDGTWSSIPLNPDEVDPPVPPDDNPGCSALLADIWQRIKDFFGWGK